MSTEITDGQIQAVAATARPFALVQLTWVEGRNQDGADAIELEHQRRMVSLRADGSIVVLCPVLSDRLAGVAIMTESVDKATEIMDDDPCVRAGMMTVKVVPCLGFPGDTIPG